LQLGGAPHRSASRQGFELGMFSMEQLGIDFELQFQSASPGHFDGGHTAHEGKTTTFLHSEKTLFFSDEAM
jgi:hypothetical protein